MKLIDLIDYLVTSSKLEILYHEQGVNQKSESLSIFMKGSVDLDSDIAIFGVEETDGNIAFHKDGIDYVDMLPVELAVDILESNFGTKRVANYDKAARLLEYAIYDA